LKALSFAQRLRFLEPVTTPNGMATEASKKKKIKMFIVYSLKIDRKSSKETPLMLQKFTPVKASASGNSNEN
jgi:hypothetical protein